MKRIILFDLETSGTPIKTDPQGKKLGWNKYPLFSDTSKYDTARVIQIGLKTILYNSKNGKHEFIEEDEFDLLIKPIGFKINNSNIHGITQKDAHMKGIHFMDAISKISPLFAKTSLIVAHNILFDYNVLMSEMYRHQMAKEALEFKKIPRFCTAEFMTPVMKLPLNRRFYKMPKLSELYVWFFKKDLPKTGQLHNASYDTYILCECFKQIVTMGYATLN